MKSLKDNTPLLVAFVIALVFCAAVSLALYFNEDLRQTTFGLIEQVRDENGEIVKRVKVEKPEPNREQVREIARHQEKKKREKLKENAKKLRKSVVELEEAAEARKSSLSNPDIWDHFAKLAGNLKTSTGYSRYLRSKSRFMTDQEGMYAAIQDMKNRGEHHAARMRSLSLLSEVESDAAWEGLNEARELVNTVQASQQLILKAYGVAETKPEGKDKQKLLRHVQERIDQIEKVNAQASQYLSEYEGYLMDKVMPESFTMEASEPPAPEPEALPLPSEAELESMDTSELYESIQEMTERMDEAYADNKASELAELEQMSIEEAKEQLYTAKTDTGPDLSEALSQNDPENSEEFSEFNEALEQAVNASNRMSRQAENKQKKVMGDLNPSQDHDESNGDKLKEALNQGAAIKAQMAQAAANAGRGKGNLQDMRSLMNQSYGISSGHSNGGTLGGSNSNGPYSAAALGDYNGASSNPNRIDLNRDRTLKQALPGRRFDMDSKRKGWIFIDTWYIIGPWNLPSHNSFETIFPPETDIDLDATYEGKTIRGKALELEWHFVQSEGLRIKPPDETSGSVYYAYTEVFCESELDAIVAVASDDRSKFWINDMVVFEDAGLSGWELDEGFRRVLLKKGYNKMLVRLENGPAVTNFSVLLCPIDAL
ncbi:hypothetical protein [Coraliomargarita parva]|uniref:hypothetical protein n=1 Tax=Coraliomargarita parva TaxID=3014050 RepID=UPI0022B5B782|nr:hypothetical protein [Coraliomargarita parva]